MERVDTYLHAVESKPSAAAAPALRPLALWHLLSLDAPAVAAAWTWFAARATHTTIPATLPVAMFLAVWLLYAADRLLDCRAVPCPQAEPLQPRHLFHRDHHRAFLLAIGAVSIALVPLILALSAGILSLYLRLATLLAAWFALIHLPIRTPVLPKELIPGLFFAAAVFLPELTAPSPHILVAALAFALVCTLNCLRIYAWEHEAETDPIPHLTTRLAMPRLTSLTVATLVIALAALPLAPPIFLAIAISAGLLLGLDRIHARLDPTTLRAAADLVLLTPILLAPFLR